MSLAKKLLKGSLWNALSQFSLQLINFLITIILARLLSPREFGLLGMVMVINAFIGYFTEFGLSPSLIRQKEIDDDDCNTVFWSTILFSLLIYIFVFFLSPFIAVFYKETRLTLISRVLFVYFIVMPLNFIPGVLEVRNLNYKRLALTDISSTFISGICAVFMAINGFGVWSLVFQHILRTLLRGLLMLFVSRWLPRISFSIAKFRKHIGFGFHYTINNLINYFSENIDFLMVGKLLGAAELGLYTISFRISKYPVQKLWGVFGKMLFPAFSSIKEDIGKTRSYFEQISIGIPLFFLPGIIFIFFGIGPIINLLLGERWLAAVVIVKLFFVYLSVNSFCIQDEPILIAFGKVKEVNLLKFISALVLLVLGYFGIKYFNIAGMALAYVFVNSILLLGLKYLVLKNLGMRVRPYLLKVFRVIRAVFILFTGLYLYSLFAEKYIQNEGLFLIIEALITIMYYSYLVFIEKLFYLKNKKIDLGKYIDIKNGVKINEDKI